ncbi:hypothetical protein Esti_004871 [Eimeria stiedai]
MTLNTPNSYDQSIYLQDSGASVAFPFCRDEEGLRPGSYQGAPAAKGLLADAAAAQLRAIEEQQQRERQLQQLRDNEERVRWFVVALLRRQPSPRMLPFPEVSGSCSSSSKLQRRCCNCGEASQQQRQQQQQKQQQQQQQQQHQGENKEEQQEVQKQNGQTNEAQQHQKEQQH